MANQNGIGVIERVQASFRSVKIIDPNGHIRVASVGDVLYKGERIVSDDATAKIEIKYNDVKEIVKYEGVVDIVAKIPVVEDSKEDGELLFSGDTNSNTDNIETAAGDNVISSSTPFMTYNNDDTAHTVSIKPPIQENITNTQNSGIVYENYEQNSLNFESEFDNVITNYKELVKTVYESSLSNIGTEEQISYVGEKIVTNFDDIKNVKFDNIKISITTDNPYLISIFENSDDIKNENTDKILQLVKDMTTDFVDDNQDDTKRQVETIELSSHQIDLLQQNHFLTIGMLPTGEYQIISPLFNALGAKDSMDISTDYSINDDTAIKNISIKIIGENDAPVAIDATQNITLNENGEYEGALPGTATYSVSLLKNINDSVDLDNGTSNIIDKDELVTKVSTDIKENLDFNVDSKMIDNIKEEMQDRIAQKLITDSASDIEDRLGDDSHTFDVEKALSYLLSNYNYTDDKDQLFKDFDEKLVEIYDRQISSEDLSFIRQSIDDNIDAMDTKLSNLNDTLVDKQDAIISSINTDSILSDLGINDQSINESADTLKVDIKQDLKDFGENLDASLLHNPIKTASEFNQTLDDVFNDLDGTVENLIGTDSEFQTAMTEALKQSIIENTNTSTDDTLMMDIIDETSSKLVESMNINVDDIKQSTLENLVDQLGINRDFLEDSSREEMGNKIVADTFERLSIDEDFGDLTSLSYSLVKGSVHFNGMSVSDDIVTVHSNGSYTLNTQGLNLDASKLTFDYTISDKNLVGLHTHESLQSEPKTMTIYIGDYNDEVSKAPALFHDEGIIDLHALINTVHDGKEIELQNKDTQINVSIEDVIEVTDAHNQLSIVSQNPSDTTLHLDDHFKQTSNENGMITFEGNLHGESVMLAIENTIHID